MTQERIAEVESSISISQGSQVLIREQIDQLTLQRDELTIRKNERDFKFAEKKSSSSSSEEEEKGDGNYCVKNAGRTPGDENPLDLFLDNKKLIADPLQFL